MTVETLLSPYEVIMREEGRAEGLQDSVLEILHVRFGSVPSTSVQKIRELTNEDVLRQALKAAVTATTLEEFVAGF